MAGPIVTNDGMTPADVEAYARQVEAQRGYPRGAFVALLKQESQLGLNQKAHAPSENSHAAGIAQIQPGTAALLAKQGYPVDVHNGKQSIDGAAHLIDTALASNGGDFDNAAQQYWAGSQKGINAHPDGALGYVKAVDKNLSVDDLIAQGTDFSGRNGHASPLAVPASGAVPASAATPAVPATTDGSTDIDALVKQGTNFTGGQAQSLDGTGAGGAVRPSSTKQRQAAAAMLAVIQDKTLDPDVAYQKAIDAAAPFGVVPNREDLRTAIGAHNAVFQGATAKPADTVTGHTVAGDLQAGAVQGARDTATTLNQGVGWVDNHVPALAALDSAAGITPTGIQSSIDQGLDARDTYNQNYNSPYSGLGRAVGNALTQAPIMGAAGGLAGATVRGALGESIGNPLVQFLAGRGGAGMYGGGNTLTQVLGRGTSLAANGAVTGAGSAALGSSAQDAPLGAQMQQGAAMGAALGPTIGAATGGYRGTGPTLDPVTANNLLRATQLNPPINIPYGRIAPSPVTRTVYSMAGAAPFSGVAANDATANGQWDANLRRLLAGDGAAPTPPDLTTSSMLQLRKDLGANYQGVGSRTTIDAAQPGGLIDDLSAWEAKAKADNLKGPMQDKIHDLVTTVTDQIDPAGNLSGKDALALTEKNGPLIGSTDPNVRAVGKQVKGIIDNHLALNATPEDADLLNRTDRAWALMKTNERAIANSDGSGIRPASLNSALTTNLGPAARSTTDLGDVDTLAQAGQYLRPPPSSQTPQGMQAINYLKLMGAGGLGVGAHLLGGHLGLPVADAAEIIPTLIGGTLAAKMMALRGQNPALTNQLIARSLNGDRTGPINYIPQTLSAIGGNQINRLTGPQPAQ
jgi:hypothetical protein